MIEIRNLVKTIKKPGIRNVQSDILKNVSLDISTNQIVSIIGPNGAGKSTTIKVLMGFVRPTAGSVQIKDQVKIGYLPENPYYYDYLTLYELLRFSAKTFRLDTATIKASAREVATRVGLGGHLHKKLRTFSKGMTQRAGLAAAIVHDPDLVILDEPMSGLDPSGRKMVFDLILDLKRRGKTILFCSHILSDVERLCDEVAILHQGEIVRRLSREELLLSPKGAEIILADTPEAVDLSEVFKCPISRYVDHLSVFVEGDRIDEVLQMIVAKRIRVLNIKSSEVPLERIFQEATA